MINYMLIKLYKSLKVPFLIKKAVSLVFCCPIHIAAKEGRCPVSEKESWNHFGLQCACAFRKKISLMLGVAVS